LTVTHRRRARLLTGQLLSAMSNDEILTDDYVAGLLAKDAQDCSLKYSAMGMEAYKTSKKYVPYMPGQEPTSTVRTRLRPVS
jgi:hypothetical protein